ncbi:hypothetical protein TRVL_09447 [Trypanosoma vivax]|nr:hypothetical protein TRVL_09447 [Trypanosoma vivax]
MIGECRVPDAHDDAAGQISQSEWPMLRRWYFGCPDELRRAQRRWTTPETHLNDEWYECAEDGSYAARCHVLDKTQPSTTKRGKLHIISTCAVAMERQTGPSPRKYWRCLHFLLHCTVAAE